MAPYLTGRVTSSQPDADRDAALAEHRALAADQIQHDLDYNLQQMTRFCDAVIARQGAGEAEPAVERDLLGHLRRRRDTLAEVDPFRSAKAEEQCWINLQQFYLDALELAERLLARETGGRQGRVRRQSDGTLRRYNVSGFEAYTRAESALRTVEVAVPNPFEMRLTRTMLPTLLHMGWHQVWPWSRLRWCDFERTTLRWLRDGGIARLRGEKSTRVRFVGRERLEDNDELFDPATGKARHNLILAGSHRVGFLDFPYFSEVLRHVDHAVWANNAFYTPGMARKMARSRTAIPIRGQGRGAMDDAVELTIEVMADDGVPLFIMADGSTKNLLYGQYLRVKRGIRVLADESVRRSAAAGRKTLIAPMTFDDPVAYLVGRCDEVVVTVHPLLEITTPTSSEPHSSVFDETAFNGGDNLLNHLEALYLLHSPEGREGLRTPDVLAVARAKHGRRLSRGWRGWLRRRFHLSVFDLCSQA